MFVLLIFSISASAQSPDIESIKARVLELEKGQQRIMDSLEVIATAMDRIATKLSQTPATPPVKPVYAMTYEQGCAASLKTGKDLLVYVGMPSKFNSYSIVCERDSLEGYPAKCIVLSRPQNGEMIWIKTMDENGNTIPERKASPSAIPFPQYKLDPKSIPRKVTVPPDSLEGKAAGPRFNASHQCPNCGAQQLVISGKGPAPGSHTHTCPNCGTVWYH
jgi:predicted RNA-binding Zn-ribbon protein involved in translation (DUF1610 family)